MAIETLLTTVLKTRCPRTFPLIAPNATPRPYVTYQIIGGPATRYVDGAAADKRINMVQINVTDDTHAGALALIRQIEDDLCASSTLQARPLSEASTDEDTNVALYGAMQDFEVVAAR